MKNLAALLTMLILVSLSTSILAQRDVVTNDCDALKKVIADAMNNFKGYEGDLIYDDIEETGHEYTINLFNDDGRSLYTVYDIIEYRWVEFYYPYAYDISDARAKYSQLLAQLEGCLSGSYFKSEDQDRYSVEYQEFTDNRDAGKVNNPSYPQVEISIQQEKDSYYVMISVFAP